MKNTFRYLLSFLRIAGCLSGILSFGAAGNQAHAQVGAVTDTLGAARHPQVAIFLPLYLDSAFDSGGNYRYDKSFPKFLNPGLEFYEGVQLALDSLEKEHALLDVHIFDTRSATRSIAQVLQDPGFDSMELIIGVVSNGELQQLAAAAARRRIPFINVNFPNDGGITNNPELVILNSTLKTHCEGIYKFLQRNYATSPIYYFRRKGVQEDRLQRYFTGIEKTTASVPLKLKFVTLEDDFTPDKLEPYLDSLRKTICIAGSLDEGFAQRFCQQIASFNKTYPAVVIGMPNWDNIADFAKQEYSGTDIVYTTPFFTSPSDNLAQRIQQYFKTRFFSRPSDMVYRGYETAYRFGKLLIHYGNNINGSLGEKKYKVFNDFDIQPVFLNRQNMTLDYFENKKLYFVTAADHELFDTGGKTRDKASAGGAR